MEVAVQNTAHSSYLAEQARKGTSSRRKYLLRLQLSNTSGMHLQLGRQLAALGIGSCQGSLQACYLGCLLLQ